MTDDEQPLNPDDVCGPCRTGFHNECVLSFEDGLLDDGVECCCRGEFSIKLYEAIDAGLTGILSDAQRKDEAGAHGIGAPGTQKDITSTGRKRADAVAEMMFPVFKGETRCGWGGLKFAGGGVVPIVGCAGNLVVQPGPDRKINPEDKALGYKRRDLHHGPDKNVLLNEPRINLHAICAVCHNRWHALNDPFYEKGRPDTSAFYLPLAPYYEHDNTTEATDEDRATVEVWWAIQPARNRPEYPFTPEKEPIMPRSTHGPDPDGSAGDEVTGDPV